MGNETSSLNAVHVVQDEFLILRWIALVALLKAEIKHAHRDRLGLLAPHHHAVAHLEAHLRLAFPRAVHREYAFHFRHGNATQIVGIAFV